MGVESIRRAWNKHRADRAFRTYLPARECKICDDQCKSHVVRCDGQRERPLQALQLEARREGLVRHASDRAPLCFSALNVFLDRNVEKSE